MEGFSRGKGQLDGQNVTAYCWLENELSKNANVIASCILSHFSFITTKISEHDIERLRLVSDRCTAQNKNTIVVSALVKWLAEFASSNIKEIEMIFQSAAK